MHKKRIILFAILSRVFVIIVQCIGNILIPDHDAGVYKYPRSFLNSTIYDKLVNVTLGGLLRWDAHYFIHIAKYGYTHESTLAFFPLYPLSVKIMASVASHFITFLNEDSLLLTMFVTFNIIFFVKAAIALYNLTTHILNADLAYKSTILFCINPATIFFVAPYTESLFSYLSFKCMLNCIVIYGKHSSRRLNNIISIILPISLSTCTRSNGILNIGFLAYFIVQECMNYLILQKVWTKKLMHSFNSLILLISAIYLCLIPFLFVQFYDYQLFCMDYKHNLSDFLVNFNEINNFVFPGMTSQYKQSWCLDTIPIAYSYIQKHYWNVGFLKYFEVKQIPNFMLALPIVMFIMYNSVNFCIMHKQYCLNLGIFNLKFNNGNNMVKPRTVHVFKPKMFIFVLHGSFLVLFCFFCIHVQVTTRMLCSASPVLYWFSAHYFEYVTENSSRIKDIFIFKKGLGISQRLILYYFISYTIIGTLMFSNFLPWT